jgi:hypothetical protein
VSRYVQRLIAPDGDEGAFNASPPACVSSDSTKLNACDDVEGTYDARHPTYIPNTHQALRNNLKSETLI